VARLGGGAAFVGKLGDDEFGRMLAAILRDNGVDDGGVVFDAGARTALAFVTLRADGEREFMFYRNPSADMLLTHAELNVELIKRVSPPLISLSPLRVLLISAICGGGSSVPPDPVARVLNRTSRPFLDSVLWIWTRSLLASMSCALGCSLFVYCA
jgi:sugar/nucleoside kinase (ribokinase family)